MVVTVLAGRAAAAAAAVACGFAVSACGGGDVYAVTVGPELVDCVGVGPQKCMVVDGEFFYSAIEGFSHEPGYTYRLRVEQYDAYPGGEPPQDAGRYGYRLVEIVDKTPAG